MADIDIFMNTGFTIIKLVIIFLAIFFLLNTTEKISRKNIINQYQSHFPFITLILTIIGTRLLTVIILWDYYEINLFQIFNIFDGNFYLSIALITEVIIITLFMIDFKKKISNTDDNKNFKGLTIFTLSSIPMFFLFVVAFFNELLRNYILLMNYEFIGLPKINSIIDYLKVVNDKFIIITIMSIIVILGSAIYLLIILKRYFLNTGLAIGVLLGTTTISFYGFLVANYKLLLMTPKDNFNNPDFLLTFMTDKEFFYYSIILISLFAIGIGTVLYSLIKIKTDYIRFDKIEN